MAKGAATSKSRRKFRKEDNYNDDDARSISSDPELAARNRPRESLFSNKRTTLDEEESKIPAFASPPNNDSDYDYDDDYDDDESYELDSDSDDEEFTGGNPPTERQPKQPERQPKQPERQPKQPERQPQFPYAVHSRVQPKERHPEKPQRQQQQQQPYRDEYYEEEQQKQQQSYRNEYHEEEQKHQQLQNHPYRDEYHNEQHQHHQHRQPQQHHYRDQFYDEPDGISAPQPQQQTRKVMNKPQQMLQRGRGRVRRFFRKPRRSFWQEVFSLEDYAPVVTVEMDEDDNIIPQSNGNHPMYNDAPTQNKIYPEESSQIMKPMEIDNHEGKEPHLYDEDRESQLASIDKPQQDDTPNCCVSFLSRWSGWITFTLLISIVTGAVVLFTSTHPGWISSHIPSGGGGGNHHKNHLVRIKYSPLVESRDTIRYAAHEYVVHTKDRDQPLPKGHDTQEQPLSILRWAELFSEDTESAEKLREEFSNLLRNSPDKAFLFETKGASNNTWTKQFEFVLIDSPALATYGDSPDTDIFANKLRCMDPVACTFQGDDAHVTLVSPKRKNRQVPHGTYSHLANFVREAPPDDVHAFWKIVAKEYMRELKKTIVTGDPVWMSTDGVWDDIIWLNIRFDSRTPQHYKYAEFSHDGET